MPENARTSAKANPKNLILELLLAAGEKPFSVRDGILACSIFDISQNSLRVTLARLSAAGLVQATGRGAYRLGPAAKDLAGDVATWRTAEQRLRSWNGGYVLVHTGALGRSDRVVLRRRERALSMLGLRELDRGLYIRPDNIEQNVDGVRQRLYKLGLDVDASVFRADGFDLKREAKARGLWNGKALTKSYRTLRVQLEDWLANGRNLPLDVAARESFYLGGNAIRQIVFDPLLPEPLVDVKERHAFIKAVQRFDDAGRAIWERFFTSIAAEASA
jgi:phenylacetic acid degradation operon negative regulatory protein